MILRHQFFSATATGILRGRTLPHCGRPCIIYCSQNRRRRITGLCLWRRERRREALSVPLHQMDHGKSAPAAVFYGKRKRPLPMPRG